MSAWFETLESDGAPRSVWDEAAGVRLIAPMDAPQVEWRVSGVESPFVDGVFETHSSIGAMRLPMRVEVFGSSPAQVEGRIQALTDDVTASHSLLLRLVVGGVVKTYRAYRPDVSAPENYGHEKQRDVFLTWRVLPHPTITGTV